MRVHEVHSDDLTTHMNQFYSEGYELRCIERTPQGTYRVIWRPTCCGGDDRQR